MLRRRYKLLTVWAYDGGLAEVPSHDRFEAVGALLVPSSAHVHDKKSDTPSRFGTAMCRRLSVRNSALVRFFGAIGEINVRATMAAGAEERLWFLRSTRPSCFRLHYLWHRRNRVGLCWQPRVVKNGPARSKSGFPLDRPPSLYPEKLKTAVEKSVLIETLRCAFSTVCGKARGGERKWWLPLTRQADTELADKGKFRPTTRRIRLTTS